MFKIIFIMCLGIYIGLLLGNRSKWIKIMDKLIYAVILLLLFSLGVDIGNNSELMQNLNIIGLNAIYITLGALLGCLFLSYLLYHFIFKNKIK